MICCIECFKDKEVRAAIELIGHKGNCSICGEKNTWIYNSDFDKDNSSVEDMLGSILEIYVPDSELPCSYPDKDKLNIAERLYKEWNIFSGTLQGINEIVKGVVENSLFLSEKLLTETVGVPQLYDEEYLLKYSIMRNHSWSEFKKSLRDVNRFHNNFSILSPIYIVRYFFKLYTIFFNFLNHLVLILLNIFLFHANFQLLSRIILNKLFFQSILLNQFLLAYQYFLTYLHFFQQLFF